jgi:hypothetical protein
MTFALCSPPLFLMGSAANLRLQIETMLADRAPAALTLKIKQAPELFANGIAEVDAVLNAVASSNPLPHHV